MEIGDLVEVLPMERLNSYLYGMHGEIIKLIGDVDPSSWLVNFGDDQHAVLRGDEVKLVENNNP